MTGAGFLPHRRMVLAASLATLACPAIPRAAPALTVVDMAGRRVALAAPPRRMVLLEARDVVMMSFLHPNPSSLVVGWAAADRIDSSKLQAAHEAAAGHAIATVGKQTADTVSLEGIISLQPDLVVASSFMQSGAGIDELARRLAGFGIPLIVSSADSNRTAPGREAPSPIDELPAALRMWGTLLDRREQAEAFGAFLRAGHERVSRSLVGSETVKTYLEVMSTYDDCCWAAGREIWGQLLARAGGRSLDGVSERWFAKVSLEHLITERPEAYIATGGGYASETRPAIGPGLAADRAREGLRRLTQRTGFDTFPAVRNRRVHGIWSGLITIPGLNLLFLEAAAKWLHPQAAAGLNPAGTLVTLNDRFLSVRIDGPLWASLDERSEF